METRAPTHEDYLAAGRGELSAEEFKARAAAFMRSTGGPPPTPRQPCAT